MTIDFSERCCEGVDVVANKDDLKSNPDMQNATKNDAYSGTKILNIDTSFDSTAINKVSSVEFGKVSFTSNLATKILTISIAILITSLNVYLIASILFKSQ